MGAIPLLIQHHAIKTMQMIKDRGGVIVANGQPMTRERSCFFLLLCCCDFIASV